jgi:photosystem II stability/assembly factor-like uncharacterized protein
MRLVTKLAFFLVFAIFCAFPQDQPQAPATPPPAAVLENRGKPMVVPYTCSAEDMQWAGLGCTEDEPCAIFLELSAAEAAGTRILVSGNLHTESVTLYSILLASDDGGHTWTEATQRIRGAALDRIEFLDATTGWISGAQLFPIPQNPFLLVTTDGGKTWDERAVLNESAEDRFGVVQQFSFADKDTGSLILDRAQSGAAQRYALFESRTGGQSWNIVEESAKPLRLRYPIPAASQWRVRVDAPTRSYHVERNQGDRWTTIAAFSVKLDPCK